MLTRKKLDTLCNFYNCYNGISIHRVMNFDFKCNNDKSNAHFTIEYKDIKYDTKHKHCSIGVVTKVNGNSYTHTGICLHSFEEAKDLMKKIDDLVREELNFMYDIMVNCIKEYSHDNWLVQREEEGWSWGRHAKDGFSFSIQDIYPNDDYMIKQMNILMDIYGDEKEVKQVKNENTTKTYLMKDDNTGLYKIGRSMNPEKREKTLQGEKPTIKMVKTWNKNIEKELHKTYNSQRVRGEWFELTPIQIKYICKHY